MLTIEYEQSLVETAVFLAVRRDEKLECEFHLAIDPLYEIPDAELRQREFGPVFRAFFTRLGLDRVIAGLTAERLLIGEHVGRCIVREAPRARAESAELFVRKTENGEPATNRTLVIQACPPSLIDSERFVHRMRRELLHVADMLDDRFGYERVTFSGEPSRQNLMRDRYRVLWDVYVEGRLRREGLGANPKTARLRQAFDKVFAHAPLPSQDGAFARVLDAPALTHRMLLEWAKNPVGRAPPGPC